MCVVQGYQSITGLYSDMVREPIGRKESFIEKNEEITELRKYLEEVDTKQMRLAQENQFLQEQMKSMMSKLEELEVKLK